MKAYIYILIAIGLFTSCTQNSGTQKTNNKLKNKIKKEVILVAENYVSEKLKDYTKSINKDGTINLTHDEIKFVIDPSRIMVGLIDDDSIEDAVVSISSYNGQSWITTELLILMNTNARFKVTKVIEGDMKVLQIKDKKIFIEVPKLAPDAPNYNCAICREVIKYKYVNGDLIRTE